MSNSNSSDDSFVQTKTTKSYLVDSFTSEDEQTFPIKSKRKPIIYSFDSSEEESIDQGLSCEKSNYENTNDLNGSANETNQSNINNSADLSDNPSLHFHDNIEIEPFSNETSNNEITSNDISQGNVFENKSLINNMNSSDVQMKSYRDPEQDSSTDSESELNDKTDSDENDDEVERNVFSPRTRKSMTGIRERDVIYESSSDEEVQIDQRETPKENICIEDSDDENVYKSNEKEDDSSSDDSVQFVSEESNSKIHQIENVKNNLFQMSNNYVSSTPAKVLQPKITNMIKEYVSQEFYDKQVIKLNELSNDLQRSISLNEKMKLNLPDNGRRLSGRIDKLKDDVKRLEHYISTLEVQTSIAQKPPNQKLKSESPKPLNAPSWSDLNAGVNAVQPKFIGKIGMKNFIAAKVMTMDRLKSIHGSLETCPADSMLADEPKNLKIPLMAHQRYALSWMEWRENQRPRGGILADDMGLGKTLTCISHILACNQRKENAEHSEEEDESDEENKSNDNLKGWVAKGRKDYKSGQTLVVCPASLIGQWEGEVLSRVRRNTLDVLVHHGNNRETKNSRIAKNDIVITTYQILARDYEKNGPLFNIQWNRVILDEGHVIRNHKTKISEAACKLLRRNCWILTGTPVQNKELDLFALMKFLKTKPFDDINQFKKWIANKSAGGQERLNTIMRGILLRRTKLQLLEKGELADLPDKKLELIEINLDKNEKNVYSKILIYSKTLFAQYLCQREERQEGYNYGDHKKVPDQNTAYFKAHQKLQQIHGDNEVKSHEILVLILRLRQICCHPGLITAMLEDNDRGELSTSHNNSNEQSISDIDMLDQLQRIKITENDFEIENESEMKGSSKLLMRSNPVYNFDRPSSKFLKILNVIETKIPITDKLVIVSQWAGVLNILAPHLSRKGIRYVSLTGSVAVKDRGAIVESFNKDNSGPRVMLLTLTAGGVGLNLIGANHLFLVDLHWNPQLEAQAQDRIYRVGQKKPVTIYKFVTHDTIEERIKNLQDVKMQISNAILTGSKSTGSALSIDDLKSLFDM